MKLAGEMLQFIHCVWRESTFTAVAMPVVTISGKSDKKIETINCVQLFKENLCSK